LEGYIIALNNLDAVIKLIRESNTPEIARTGLMENFAMSEIQARAVLELRLQSLTGMQIEKVREEFAEIMKTIGDLKDILANEGRRFQIIKDELAEVKKKFGDERKSEIDYGASEMDMLDMIADEDVVITISHLGYIKRTSQAEYRAQRRGGRGARGGKTREEDFIEHLFIASTHHTLLIFTEKGRCFWLRVYKIPETDKNAKGRAIQNLIQLPPDDKIRTILNVPDLEKEEYTSKHFIVLCTKEGIIKKTSLEDFSRPRSNGVNAITIREDDQLLEARLTDGNSYIMMAVNSGRAICFPEEKVRPTGRGAIGVYGIDMADGKDYVIGMVCVNKFDTGKQILVVSEKGLGKRTPFLEKLEEGTNTDDMSNTVMIKNAEGGEEQYQLAYRVTNRGGKGVKTINITEKTGSLVGLLAVEEKDDLMITCKSGMTIRMKVRNIREAGRATQGVKLINLDNNDEIAALASIDEQEEEVELDENGEPIDPSPALPEGEGDSGFIAPEGTETTEASEEEAPTEE
jgi:DNA gyrase subunit A